MHELSVFCSSFFATRYLKAVERSTFLGRIQPKNVTIQPWTSIHFRTFFLYIVQRLFRSSTFYLLCSCSLFGRSDFLLSGSIQDFFFIIILFYKLFYFYTTLHSSWRRRRRTKRFRIKNVFSPFLVLFRVSLLARTFKVDWAWFTRKKKGKYGSRWFCKTNK